MPAKRKTDNRELHETDKPEVKQTKNATKREKLEEKMIEFIDLTKKAEPEAKNDYISIQLEGMGEAIRDSLTKRQQFNCLHEMQGIVYKYVSNQLDIEEGLQGKNNPMQMQQMPQQQQQPQMDPMAGGYRNLLYAEPLGMCSSVV